MDEDVLAQMNDREKRDRILLEFNASTLDPVGPVRGDQGMKVLGEMNELPDFENDNWNRQSGMGQK